MADRSADPAWSIIAAAEELSERHALATGPAAPIPALKALGPAAAWLHDVRLACADPPPEAGKAAEWLLDNDYQVHRALRQIRKDLPANFYARLPALAGEDARGLPRIFAVAHEMLRVTRLQTSLVSAVRFVSAYQKRSPLTIAELWAFPTMLRIACLEILVEAISPFFGGRISLPFAPTAYALDPHSLDETERVARSIANLGLVAAIPWEDFFDQTSVVEKILAGDPSGHYRSMDFETRDRYRRAVELLAERGEGMETDVAAEVVRRAGTARDDDPRGHVGYWLIGAGRRGLEADLRASLPYKDRLRRYVLDRPGAFYAAAVTLCSIGALILPAGYLAAIGATPVEWAAALLLALIPASTLAMTVVHWTITRLLPPRVLPKLDFSDGIARDCPTLVVVPVVVGSAADVPDLAEQIETHWLANADKRLQIVLLADPADAPVERTEADGELEQALASQIQALNKRHGRKGVGPFHLFLRPRLYNAAQGCWMAWERKRGKLEQFNRLLVEGAESAFSLHVGNPEALKGTRFIVTVDADTMLPPGSVARLAGTLAHPLNRARFDEAAGRVTDGYSIIQPRTEISPESGTRTLFARLFTGDTAIDIYSRAVSDVYQDLFGAGIFVGKGIYDLQAFHRSVDGRVPENSILSHDLFEGAHGRVALATDIVLYEGFPATYLEHARRLHRWIRGDWQLLPWLRRTVPAADGTRLPNRLARIDRWKILDNLRRSLIAPSILLLALAGWFALPGSPLFWTLLAVFAPGGQLITDLVSGLGRGRRRDAMRGLLDRLADQAGRWFLAIAFLIHEALLSLHAVGVTLWRLLVSGRNLLEWTTAAAVAVRLAGRSTRRDIWLRKWSGVAAALFVAGSMLVLRPSSLPVALPLLLLWTAAPEIALYIGRARKTEVEPLSTADSLFLRELARRTWLYFETFAGPEDNWLPPDNYQGEPHEETAHRTSPTNIGMMLLSTATAWDLGYVGRAELAARTRNVFHSLGRLERYRGHYFNWYDTRTLKPLEPRYVSAVDSGNLAVSLVALAVALREAGAAPALGPQRWSGLADVVRLLRAALDRLKPVPDELKSRIGAFERRLSRIAADPAAWPSELAEICHIEIPKLETQIAEVAADSESAGIDVLRELFAWLDRLRHQARTMLDELGETSALGARLVALAGKAAAIADAMDFSPLYDQERRLFFIGHNVSAGRTDTHHYDLLASEARLASFFAIAKGDVPIEHWFHLGRPVTRAGRRLTLLSWNGSMFEYLMPRLLLHSGQETLLGESEQVAVEIQRRYGVGNDVPWGISESAYSARDPDHRYRYQAFGVPGLGLRRGLARDLVIAPYASALALAVVPAQAAANLRALDELGRDRRYGLVEAIDYTPERARPGGGFTPVNAYMAHHQGMILCAIGNALNDDILVRRFAEDPRMRLISLLLSERIPREIPSEIERIEELERPAGSGSVICMPAPWEPATAAPFPQVNLLGNGRLSSWISESGGGGLKWRKSALTRFVPDAARDADGVWIYVADEESGALWSATRQPTGAPADEYHAVFRADFAEFNRRDHGIRLRLEVGVAAGDDIEIRRLTVADDSGRPRRLRLTSYGEVVLAPPLEDERHPAFSKLFVGGEPEPALGGLLFSRRARNPHETPPVLLHVLIGSDGPVENIRHECDRRAFIGRGRDLRDPAGARADLANGSGWTLDPVMALQASIELEPYGQRELCFLTIAAATREAAVDMAERYATLPSIEWALNDAASECAHVVERARLDPTGFAALQTLASMLIHPHPAMRAEAARVRENRLGQPNLWGLALSGDNPVLLLRAGTNGETLLPDLISAHHWWRRHGLETDLVILQGAGSTYVEPIREDIVELLRDLGATEMLGRNGGVHLLFADQIGPQQVHLLEAAASAVLDDSKGSVADQVAAALKGEVELPEFAPSLADDDVGVADLERPQDLLFDNGIGGFSPDGREYVIHLEPGEATPAPWANVLANDGFGCLVTETGGGFTWAVNSGENRLTPWTNDPVSDRPVEALYLRDEETAAVWSTTPAPAGQAGACQVRHGAGFTEWRRRSQGLEQEMLVLVPPDAPVKIVRLRLRNLLPRHRRLTSTYYAEWLLGAVPSLSRRQVVCDFDAQSHVLLARSWWNPEFAGRAAFLAASRPPHGLTTDRTEFIGREGSLARPAGLRRWGLSGRLLSGGDVCGAYQVHLELAPGESDELVFVLGQGVDEAEAKALAAQWADPRAAGEALAATQAHWDRLLGAVEVRTPDPAFDLIVNRWLIYQSLSSRVMARTGFYQASGAIGFRDQLQDVLALVHVDPARVRAHILRCAEHQFVEGDVLHWWHPPSSRGVRTRCSDDLLWLPYAVGTYVRATGDAAILDEVLSFLEAPPLAEDEGDRYARFEATARPLPLIDHCERALERALTQGAHGLPLIGSGDWNDGFDRVGRSGRGESVWLAWFIAVTAELVADLNRRLDRDAAAKWWIEQARALRSAAEEAGWDGAWYRRAYDDDGHALGSSESDECRIDSISQSWAAFAGAEPERVATALESARRELIDPDAGLTRLLWPPFDVTPRDPGYIKAYPPGVRENGGQYSHAAAWLGLAFARTGRANAALQVFHTISPVARSADRARAEHYRVEPYVVAADIAAAEPHRGRGGWTWYTGSAAWAWRLAVEGLLGITLDEGRIRLNPCIPSEWGGFEAVLRRPEGSIAVRIEDPDRLGSGLLRLTVDGMVHDGPEIAFPTDGSTCEVVGRLSAEAPAARESAA